MQRPKLMGVLNLTPDSFLEESRRQGAKAALERALELEKQGADILDVGGESTRPFSEAISLEEEIKRVIPALEAIQGKLKIPVSIDSKKPELVEKALACGASIINDITGFSSPKMQELAAKSGAQAIVMHMQGSPKNMQLKPEYQKGVISELLSFFEERVEALVKAGVKEEQIILDPGIGFGKTVEDCLEILWNCSKLKSLGFPILIAASRKSFMQKILKKKPKDLLSTTVAIHTMSLIEGADYLRVHDVEAHREVLDVMFYSR